MSLCIVNNEGWELNYWFGFVKYFKSKELLLDDDMHLERGGMVHCNYPYGLVCYLHRV